MSRLGINVMTGIKVYLYIALGGATGACLRFFISDTLLKLLGKGFPFATLTVIILGSFMLGFLYGLLEKELKVGSNIISSKEKNIPFKTGNCTLLKNIPDGVSIHNIELKPGKGAQMARSAGTYARIMAKENNMITLKLPSGEIRMVLDKCLATIGVVGNKNNEKIKIGKAGRSRWLGRRPKVRGVAMNPVDHPHGGGEGKTSGGRSPVSPWGQSAKGLKTRKNKVTSKYIILRRKKRN